MPYPDSPFPENLWISNEKLVRTLKWLCSAPKISSIRVNTLKTSLEVAVQTIKHYLKVNNKQLVEVHIHPCILNTIIINYENVENKTFQKYEKEVIVDVECGSAVLRGAHIYAPGVLAMVSGTQLDDDVSIYVDVARRCKKGMQKIFEDQKIFIGNGEVKLQRHQLFSPNIIPSGVAVDVTETISGSVAISDRVLPLGNGLLQNLPSILCVIALNPEPEEIVLDMCASPGNKTTHLAELMRNKGILVAIDKTPKKVEQLKVRCEEFGAKVYIFQADSTTVVLNSSTVKEIIDGPPFIEESFDKILLDAPCSVLGKRPQLANKMSANEIKSYVPLQRKLFQTATKLLRPGGSMVYSTCTLTLAENEGIVAWALRNFTNLELVKPHLSLGGAGWVGAGLTDAERLKVQRFGPDDGVDSVGFFFACFIKKPPIK